MFQGLYEILYYLPIIGFSSLLVFLLVPSIIYVANQYQLFDNNQEKRKKHCYGICRLGGIAIFCSMVITMLLFPGVNEIQSINYLIIACMMIFAMGLKDDLWGVNHGTKFFIQLLVAFMIVMLADVRLSSMYNIFNIQELNMGESLGLSILVIIFIVNAFNLIDGIDGLLGITSVLVGLTFALLFISMNQPAYASLAFSMTGAAIGFLRFNILPAKIFMGDAGSLLLGLIAAILSIKFIELNNVGGDQVEHFNSAPAIAVAVLIWPIFDTIRIFILRIINKKSPFIADDNHLHHRILKLGLTHFQATFLITCIYAGIILLAFHFRYLSNTRILGMLLIICVLLNMSLNFLTSFSQRRVGIPV